MFFFSSYAALSQISTPELSGANLNTINTAVPFVTIAPDTRSAGMGDVGVASTPDINSQHWNAAKYAFIEKKAGISLTYTPWLRKIIPDINLFYLSGYYRINEKNVVSTSFRYFSLGSIAFTNINGTSWGQFTPREMTFDAGYSRKLTDHFSASVVVRYIHSDLTSGQLISGEESIPGKSFAGDLGLYYQNQLMLGERETQYAFGLHISNVGTPLHYTTDADKVPIPANLRIGGKYSLPINQNHSISMMMDVNKLLVPTSPIWTLDSISGDYVIVHGQETPEGVFAGMLQSFYDAPGYVLADGSRSILLEELHEIMIGIGIEYWYKEMLAARMGYFHQHVTKGNRKYITFGLTYNWRRSIFDFAYLLPVNGQESPLANSLRLSWSLEF